METFCAFSIFAMKPLLSSMNSAGSPVGGMVAFMRCAGASSNATGSVAQPLLQSNVALSSSR